MTDHVRRIDRILAPEYLDGLDRRDIDELRAMERESIEVETEISYVRRLAQGRIDILAAEGDRRAAGGALGDLIAALPTILADDDSRSGPATTRVQPVLAPAAGIEWNRGLERLITDGTLANLPNLTDAELQATIGQLRELERDVSAPPARRPRRAGRDHPRDREPARPRPGGMTHSRPTRSRRALRDLGEFIRDQRRRDRLSLRKLSELAGISNPYLSQIERGLRKPSAEILQGIAKGLRISAETLYVRAGILDETCRVRPRGRDPQRRLDHRAPEADPARRLPLVPGPTGPD